MAKNPPSHQQLLTMLAAAPPRIAELTVSLSAEQLQAAPAPGEWSANQVLAHLRSCTDMWGAAIQRILAEEHPTIKAVNPRTWIEQTDYEQQDFQCSLHTFTTQRCGLLSVLMPLAADGWERSATIIGAGAPLERTVRSYVERLVDHERPHLQQIAAIVKVVSEEKTLPLVS